MRILRNVLQNIRRVAYMIRIQTHCLQGVIVLLADRGKTIPQQLNESKSKIQV